MHEECRQTSADIHVGRAMLNGTYLQDQLLEIEDQGQNHERTKAFTCMVQSPNPCAWRSIFELRHTVHRTFRPYPCAQVFQYRNLISRQQKHVCQARAGLQLPIGAGYRSCRPLVLQETSVGKFIQEFSEALNFTSFSSSSEEWCSDNLFTSMFAWFQAIHRAQDDGNWARHIRVT